MKAFPIGDPLGMVTPGHSVCDSRSGAQGSPAGGPSTQQPSTGHQSAREPGSAWMERLSTILCSRLPNAIDCWFLGTGVRLELSG